MTHDPGETNRLLAEILSAIHALDQSLKTHERRMDTLEKVPLPVDSLEGSVREHLQALPLKIVYTPLYYRLQVSSPGVYLQSKSTHCEVYANWDLGNWGGIHIF